MFTKALRSPQKLQVMAAVLGADPVFCFPWLLKLHACASWSLSVWDHTSHHQDFLQCQRMNCTAPSIWQQSRTLSRILFCGDVGAGEP